MDDGHAALATHDIGVQELFSQPALPQALTDPAGRFVMANRSFCDLVGFSEADLLDQDLDTLTHADDAAAQARCLRKLVRGPSPLQHLSARYLRSDGVVLQCRVALAVVRDDSGGLRYVHAAVEQVSMPRPRGPVEQAPVVVRPLAIATAQVRRVQAELRTGHLQVVLLRLEGLEDIAAVIGWGGVDTAHAQVVSRVAATAGVGIRAIVPFGPSELLVLADSDDVGGLPSVLHSALRTPVALGGFRLPVGLRIGLSTGNAEDDPETLLRRARVALNHAVRSGTPEVRYEPGLDAAALHDFALGIEIAHALANDDFSLHYQPKYTLAGHEPAGFEALLRWEHPDRGNVPAETVVRLAESSGLIAPLTCWVIDAAAAQLAAWRDAGTPSRVAVNIAPSMLSNPMLPLRLTQALTRHGLPASAMDLEITETALATSPQAVSAVVQLADLGFGIHIDDFGCGYSGMAAIRSLPLRAIKVDHSFVRNVLQDRRDQAVISAIVDLAHRLGSQVVAEGVEDRATLELLGQLGCDLAQGFHLGVPASAAECAEHLRPPGHLRAVGQDDELSPVELLTPAEASRLLGVSAKLLADLGAQGRLSVVRTLGGHRRYAQDSVLRLAAELRVEANG